MTPSEEQAEQDTPSERPRSCLTITIAGCHDGMVEAVRQAATRTLQSQGYSRGDLEIAIVSEAEMRRQHAQWKNDDSTTDVLSFDLRETASAGLVDGQLLVCGSVAKRRSRSRKTDWRGELLLYVVHGCLHLCGLDDHDAHAAQQMHGLEDEILRDLGWGSVFSASEGSSRRPQARGACGGKP